jgi:hypothetical protein
MRILAINEIVRKDVPIYYRRLYSGVADIEVLSNSMARQIDFSIENKPTGKKEILVSIAEPVDYPLVPLLRELKSVIDTLDDDGALPL